MYVYILILEFMIRVAGEVIIVILCVLHRVLKSLKKPSRQVKEIKSKQTLVQIQQAKQEKKNVELEQFEQKKKQLQRTIQQYNTPSTFAKYSKMKRELIKLQAKINQIKSKIGQQSGAVPDAKIQSQPKVQVAQKKIDLDSKTEYLMPNWFGLFFNIVIMCLAYTLQTSVLPKHDKFPLDLITDANGRANCLLVYFACKMLMS